MNKKVYVVTSGIITLLLSYIGYIVVYLIAKQIAIAKMPLEQTGISPDSITFIGSIPSLNWFIFYSLAAFLVGIIIGFFILKIKKRTFIN